MADEETIEPQEGNESPDENDEASALDDISEADLRKLVFKYRKEAASRRVKGKELEEKASKWEEHVKSQMTELERLTADRDTLAKELAAEKVESLRRKIVAETGLDPELAEFLTGSEKEMKAQAAKLAGNKAGASKGVPDFYAGPRGNQVKPNKTEEPFDDFMRKMWNDSEKNSGKQKFTSS